MSSDFIRELKDSINIADVVGEYVRLRKSGTSYMGLCPFHGERSASFSVSETKGVYHCFGCQKGGDVISFVQEIQAISFLDAVKLLANKFGLKVPPEIANRSGGSGKALASQDEDIFFRLNRFVAQFYHEKLLGPEGEKARTYLKNRGIRDEIIRQAYLGFASAEWADLYEFLKSKQAPLEKAEALGLIRRKSTGADASGRSHFDLFRNRIIFPVLDLRGRVVAFGGRALDDDGPKYLNSSDSPIFKKGRHLYGIFAAQKDIRAEDSCIIVEGFMDCLTLQQAGLHHTVATLGTALTEEQVGILKRISTNISLLFDGDSAGKEAQDRAMEICLNEGVVARGVYLPNEMDPDEFVKSRGPEELAEMVKKAPFLLDQKILELVTQAGAHSELRGKALERVLPWIAKMNSETSQLLRLQELSTLFEVPLELLKERLQALLPKKKQVASNRGEPQQQRFSRNTQERGFSERAASRDQGRSREWESRDFSGNASDFNRRPQREFGKDFRRPQNSFGRSSGHAGIGPKIPAFSPVSVLDSVDIRLLECLVLCPKFVNEISCQDGLISGIETESVRVVVEQIIAAVRDGKASKDWEFEILDWIENSESTKPVKLMLKGVLTKALIRSEQQSPTETGDIKEFKDLEAKLIRRGLEKRREGLRVLIRKLESSGNFDEFAKVMSEYNELVKKLDENGREPNRDNR